MFQLECFKLHNTHFCYLQLISVSSFCVNKIHLIDLETRIQLHVDRQVCQTYLLDFEKAFDGEPNPIQQVTIHYPLSMPK